VTPGMPVVRVMRIDSLKVVLGLPQNLLGKVRPGMTVRIQTDAYPGRTFTGHTRSIAAEADPTTGTFPLEAVFENPPDRPLKDGLVVDAWILLERMDDALTVPLEAIQEDASGSKVVYVVRDSTARKRPVELGRTVDHKVIVQAGLEAGEVLAVTGAANLRDGARVTIEGWLNGDSAQ